MQLPCLLRKYKKYHIHKLCFCLALVFYIHYMSSIKKKGGFVSESSVPSGSTAVFPVYTLNKLALWKLLR